MIKKLPKMINKRIYDLSCNEEEFNKAKPLYENALKGSGYTTSLKYQKVPSSSQTNEICQGNCSNPASCPLDGKCLPKNTVYKVVVSTITNTYYGSS